MDGTQSIGKEVYANSGLHSVDIPASVTSVGQGAFSGCGALEYAYFKGDPPRMGGGVFAGAAPDFKVWHDADRTGFTNPWCGYAKSSFIAEVRAPACAIPTSFGISTAPCLTAIPRSRALMIGDRAPGIPAGRNAGIAACFFSPDRETCGYADYNIRALDELYAILGLARPYGFA